CRLPCASTLVKPLSLTSAPSVVQLAGRTVMPAIGSISACIDASSRFCAGPLPTMPGTMIAGITGNPTLPAVNTSATAAATLAGVVAAGAAASPAAGPAGGVRPQAASSNDRQVSVVIPWRMRGAPLRGSGTFITTGSGPEWQGIHIPGP